MTSLDLLVKQIADGVNALSSRARVALYAACAHALLPEARKWAALRGTSVAPLEQALHGASAFAAHGIAPADDQLAALLRALEDGTPHGESPDAVPSTFAQDCWICADVAVRVLAEPSFDAGACIEYALEPVLQTACERLFGCSQVGGGPDEERQVRAILAHPIVAAATDFVRWAVALLAQRPSPSEDDLSALRSRVEALAP